ncbi:SRPBCC family protein [Branchiibius cervicis]|uniref:SRPBCC family protein n=1 Tax=Branchiibius cervicis TaxID=908252 RepID=A0ABW2AR28_9MICO
MSDSTRASVVIEAPSATVLDVIADFDEYPAWAEQVKRATVLSEDEGVGPCRWNSCSTPGSSRTPTF